MTARGFCVVAALSSQTSGRPCTRSARIGKSRRMACTSKPGWAEARPAAGSGETRAVCSGGARELSPVERASLSTYSAAADASPADVAVAPPVTSAGGVAVFGNAEAGAACAGNNPPPSSSWRNPEPSARS